MEMYQVRYFLALCAELNFTRAARRCQVAQPSLTNGIKSLERDLGAVLFDRRKSGVRPTQLAVAVRPYLEQIEEGARRVRELTRHDAREGTSISFHSAEAVGKARFGDPTSSTTQLR